MSERPFEFQVCTLPPCNPERMHELSDAACRAGFDRFWISDQTFHVDPFVMLDHLASRTPVALGLAVTNPFVRHPAQLARAMATLAHLHPDRRWVFGLGTANPQNVLEPLGVQLKRGPGNVGAAIEAIKSLVAGESVSVDDPRLAFSLRDVQLEIDPPPPFDLYIGTRGPRMLETAGALADGAIVEAQFTPNGIAWARERLDAGSRRASRGPERSQRIELVAADGAGWIEEVVRERCPNASICLDPFHVVQWATTALDEVRREVWNQARHAGQTAEAKALKCARFCLWKNPEDLSGRQQATLAQIAQTNEPLYRAYLLKEQLRQALKLPVDEALALLERWLAWARRSRLPAFVKLAQQIAAHLSGIAAALAFGLSNARTESVNTRIRLIARRAFGFHSPQALIALSLLALGGLCPPLPGRSS